MNGLAAFLTILAALSAAEAAAQGLQYTITDLGTLPGWQSSYATGINNSGQVVGYCEAVGFVGGAYAAFVYSGGQMQPVGAASPASGYYTRAWAINGGGQIVGDAGWTGPWGPGGVAFLSADGCLQSLDTLPGSLSMATAINSSGQIAGLVCPNPIFAHSPPRAFLYSSGAALDLGTLPGGSWAAAYGINDAGQVVGTAGDAAGDSRAFLCSGGTMLDLGALSGGSNSAANAINASGQIVGMADNSSGWGHAFLYSNGTMQDLGVLPGTEKSTALAINQSGQVVGEADSGPYSVSHAFVYTGGTVLDLNGLIDPSSGWVLQCADGINDRGQIVGYGVNPGGQTDAFLLTPSPEPSTLCLSMICGSLLLACHHCRRRHAAPRLMGWRARLSWGNA
jgi:probable HAF family extracellular repeat protein